MEISLTVVVLIEIFGLLLPQQSPSTPFFPIFEATISGTILLYGPNSVATNPWNLMSK